MTQKMLPFTKDQIAEIIKKYPTPFHIYDEKAIRENASRYKNVYAWSPDFMNFFAVKATPNPHIIKILSGEGFGADCSSLPELLLAEKTGITGNRIMFTSNDTPAGEYIKAKELGAIINLDDISHIDFLEEHAGLPELLCFRYNPDPLKGGNAIIGKPEEAKWGLTRDQLFEAYRSVKSKGVKRFGLHTMVASNELDPDYFIDTAKLLFDLALELSKTLGIGFEFINMGGGIGIPNKPEQEAVDLEKVSAGIKKSI